MRVLVACEFSGRVALAFRNRGHEAWSCDLEPSSMGDRWHIQGDALRAVVGGQWDMLLAFPPCTHLCNSGARWFPAKRADGRQQLAVQFFKSLAAAPVPRVAIENPVGVMSRLYRAPDQIIQPWQHGHGETKSTCLWLRGLPKLEPTNIVPGREPRIHRMSPGPERAAKRSLTYQGIAEAMAEQWGRSWQPAQLELFGGHLQTAGAQSGG